MNVNIVFNLLAIPGAKYVQLKGSDQPVIMIPADTGLLNIYKRDNGKMTASVPVSVVHVSAERSARLKSNPTHTLSVNPSEEYRASMVEKMRLYLTMQPADKYDQFLQETFQNAQGTAKLPQSAEEAARWYVNRTLEAGIGWQQKPQAPKAEESVEIIPEALSPETADPYDDLPF